MACVVELSDGSILVYEQDEGKLKRSTDGGQSWSDVLTPTYDLSLISEDSGGVVFTVSTHHVYRSTDYGATWSSITPPSNCYPHDIFFLSGTTYGAFRNSSLNREEFYSLSGTTWTLVTYYSHNGQIFGDYYNNEYFFMLAGGTKIVKFNGTSCTDVATIPTGYTFTNTIDYSFIYVYSDQRMFASATNPSSQNCIIWTADGWNIVRESFTGKTMCGPLARQTGSYSYVWFCELNERTPYKLTTSGKGLLKFESFDSSSVDGIYGTTGAKIIVKGTGSDSGKKVLYELTAQNISTFVSYVQKGPGINGRSYRTISFTVTSGNEPEINTWRIYCDDSGNDIMTGLVTESKTNDAGFVSVTVEEVARELFYRESIKSFSGRTISYMVEYLVDNFCMSVYHDSSVDSTTMTMDYENRSDALIKTLALFANIEDKVVYWDIDGKLYFTSPTTSSGVTLSDSAGNIANCQRKQVATRTNRIVVYGATCDSGSLRVEANDYDLQFSTGEVVEVVVYRPQMLNYDELDALASTLLSRFKNAVNEYEITAVGVGLLQPGETISFAWSPWGMSATTLVVLEIIEYDGMTDIIRFRASEGILDKYKPADTGTVMESWHETTTDVVTSSATILNQESIANLRVREMKGADDETNAMKVGDGATFLKIWADGALEKIKAESGGSTTTAQVLCPVKLSSTSGHDLDMNGRSIVDTSTDHIDVNEKYVRIIGSATGASNYAWLGFYQSDGTRTGYIGDARSGTTDIVVGADSGKIALDPSSGYAAVFGTSTGTANKCYLAFYQSDESTRDGYVGVGSTSSRSMFLVADAGDINLNASSYLYFSLGGNQMQIYPSGGSFYFKNKIGSTIGTNDFYFYHNGGSLTWIHAADFKTTCEPIPERTVLDSIRALRNHPKSGEIDKDVLRKMLPEAYCETQVVGGKLREISIGGMINVLIKAVQELIEKIEKTNGDIAVLAERVAVVEKALEVILD